MKGYVPFDVVPRLSLPGHRAVIFKKRRRGNPWRTQEAPPAVVVPPCRCKEIVDGHCPVCGFEYPKDPRSLRIGGKLVGTVMVPVYVPHPQFRGDQARKYLAHHPSLATRREEYA